MKNMYTLIGALGVALILTFLTPFMSPQAIETNVSANVDIQKTIIEQKVVETTKSEQTQNVLFYKDQIIGVMIDEKKLDDLLKEAYEGRYKVDFPDTKLGLGEDIHVVQEVNFFQYENKDEEILAYISENDLFSVESNKVEFSNGEVIYVKNIEDFYKAKDEFALNFIDKEIYDVLNNGKELPELGDREYGTRIKSAKFIESMSVSKGLAPVAKIAKNADEALKILSYGYDAETKYYTTKEYDTVIGVAWLQTITTKHLLSLNQDVLVSENQLLPVGTVLNVTSLNSPIHFEIISENQEEEEVYPNETQIVYDATLREGMEIIDVKQELGLENARYQETFVNGESTGEGKKISSVITKQPIREVKRVGTKVYPHIGSGHFRWPVDNPSVSCGWYCYSPHPATDYQNRYNHYGKVLASDRGTIIENSYTGYNGFYIVIDHNNGYTTYYGHMSGPGFYPVGTVVQQGEEIGNIGMTGFATGPHVHLEIRKDGVQLNPETLVGK